MRNQTIPVRQSTATPVPNKGFRELQEWMAHPWYEQVTRFGLLPLGVNPEDVWQASREEEAGQLIPP